MAEITELKDLRPPEGEYFYTDGLISHRDSTSPACFVCGIKSDKYYSYTNVHGIVQCLLAARRVAAMFKNWGACYGFRPLDQGGASFSVSACESHKHNADMLRRLIGDGVITLERVRRAEGALVSAAEFHELTAKEARSIWNIKQPGRARQDWYDAFPLCCKELGHIPSPAQRGETAERLHEERKGAQEKEDWLEAEKKVSALYRVNASLP